MTFEEDLKDYKLDKNADRFICQLKDKYCIDKQKVKDAIQRMYERCDLKQEFIVCKSDFDILKKELFGDEE